MKPAILFDAADLAIIETNLELIDDSYARNLVERLVEELRYYRGEVEYLQDLLDSYSE